MPCAPLFVIVYISYWLYLNIYCTITISSDAGKKTLENTEECCNIGHSKVYK